MLRHFISTELRLCALALLLHAGALLAQPDPASYGVQVEAGNIVQVRAWLDAGLDPDYLADHIGTGLMIAAWQGDIAMMELLVARGADVDKENALGERALMHAAWRGHVDAVKWLLARGARIDNDAMRWSPLHYAAFAGHGDVAALLLDRGADINARSPNGSSALMMAVYEGQEQMVRQLIARGADRGIRNDRGDGALEWAFKFQRLSIARLVAAPQDFVAAANLPKSQWGEPVRSQPAPAAGPGAAAPDPAGAMSGQIEDLMKIRSVLASRGMTGAASKLDRRIAALRAQRARAGRDATPAAVFEISASRSAPGDQKARLIFETDGPPP